MNTTVALSIAEYNRQMNVLEHANEHLEWVLEDLANPDLIEDSSEHLDLEIQKKLALDAISAAKAYLDWYDSFCSG